MLKDKLNNYSIILGSASPRRHELLKGLDINFTIDTKNNFNEEWYSELPLTLVPEFLSKGKSKGFHRELLKNEILITADTMVLCNNQIFGKPKDKEDAMQMLNQLQNNTHQVLTGVCIRSCDKIRSFTSTTSVTFGEISKEEIEYYIDKYKPFDKAGAYGVQEWIGYIGIKNIDRSEERRVGKEC